jgi:hypothetical protein
MTTSNLPAHLYHGTRATHFDNLANFELVPRGVSGNSRWTHSVESRPDAVYLSTAYPLHYAINAAEGGDILIIEIATDHLDTTKLIADEDALAHGKDDLPRTMDLAERTRYYRERAHLYPANVSLRVMGTCSHLGPIPATAITRIARVPEQGVGRLVLGGLDPVVSPIHYAIFAKEFEQSVRWLFGDEAPCLMTPVMPRPEVEVLSRRSLA